MMPGWYKQTRYFSDFNLQLSSKMPTSRRHHRRKFATSSKINSRWISLPAKRSSTNLLWRRWMPCKVPKAQKSPSRKSSRRNVKLTQATKVTTSRQKAPRSVAARQTQARIGRNRKRRRERRVTPGSLDPTSSPPTWPHWWERKNFPGMRSSRRSGP